MRRREGWGVGLTPGLSPKEAASDLKPYPSVHGELELGFYRHQYTEDWGLGVWRFRLRQVGNKSGSLPAHSLSVPLRTGEFKRGDLETALCLN